jgi:hypothetical protein
VRQSDRPTDRVEHVLSHGLATGGSPGWKRAESTDVFASFERLSQGRLAGLRRELSERDVAIVHDVARCRSISARQLQQLHFPVGEHATLASASRSCRRVLQRLSAVRLIVPLPRRVGGIRAGSDGLVFSVGSTGRRLLGELRPGGQRPPSERFVAHALAVADVYVALQLAARAGRCKLVELSVEAEAWQRFGSLSGQQLLAPDLFVQLHVDDEELAWWLEVDLATEHAASIRTKAERYLGAYRSGAVRQGDGLFPRVLWIVPSEARRAELAAAVRRVERRVPGLFAVVVVRDALVTVLGQTDVEPL